MSDASRSELRRIKLTEVGFAGILGGGIVAGVAALAIGFIPGIHLGLTKGGGTTNPPIKVRGGAMTFRAPKKWMPIVFNSLASFCSDKADISAIAFADVQIQNSASLTTPLEIAQLQKGWTMKLLGRDSHNPGSGVLVTAQQQSCTGTQGISSLVLSPQNDGNSLFYTTDGPDDDGTKSVRFENKTCGGPGGGASGDEDVCEHISTITLTLDKADAPGSSTTSYVYQCTNGDCTIGIGSPN